MGLAPALYEEITYDELGNNLAGTFMDYLLPTAVETPGLGDRQDDHPVAASSDRRQGGGGVGHRRRPAGHRQRGRRRPVAPRRPQHRHPDHAPEGLGHPPREGHGLDRHDRAVHLRAGRRARGGGSVVRGRHGRGGPAADLGASGRVRHRPPGRHDRGLGRRQLRPARRRPRGAPRARRRAAAPAPAVEGRAGRGSPGRRRHRARHDLPLRWHPGDLRGTAPPRSATLGRRHDADRRRARAPRLGRRAGGSPSSTRSPRPTPSRASSGSTRRPDIRGLDPDASPYVVVATQGIWDEEAVGLALTRDASYVGLVASPTRAGVVRDWLREETTVGDERIAALRAPGRPRPRAPRPPRRSRCRSSPSSSRSGAAGRTSSPRPDRRRSPAAIPETITLEPVVDDIVLLDPVCGMTVERAHARHLAEHDGVIYAFCSIGCRTRFIKEPAAYLSASASVADARLTDRPSRRTRMHFEGSVPIKASREKVWAFVIDPEQVGPVRPGRREDRGHRRDPLQGDGQGRDRVHQRAVQREHGVRRAAAARPGGHQGPRPGAGQRRRRDGARCACRTDRTARPSWTGAPT